MTTEAWGAVLVSTAIGSAGFWAAALVVNNNSALSFTLVAVSSIVAILALATMSGGPEAIQAGIRSATYGLALGALLMFVFGLTGNAAIAVIVPTAVLGVGAVSALAPRGVPELLMPRTVAAGLACAVVVALAVVLPPVAILGAPLLPIAAVGGADELRNQRSGA